MSEEPTDALSVVVECEIPVHRKRSGARSPKPHLIEERVMKSDFKPVTDHRFNLCADGALSTVGPGRRAEAVAGVKSRRAR